jgi:hypothetical protein
MAGNEGNEVNQKKSGDMNPTAEFFQERVLSLAKEGMKPKSIADKLKADGVKTSRGTAPDPNYISSLISHNRSKVGKPSIAVKRKGKAASTTVTSTLGFSDETEKDVTGFLIHAINRLPLTREAKMYFIDKLI